MSTIEDSTCPACSKQLKNRHGVISHLSSGTCPSDESTVRRHQILNIAKEKLLIYVASIAEPVGDASSLTLKNIVQITGQENVKSSLDTLAEEGNINKSEINPNNPAYSITDAGLTEIERAFESNPDRLEEIAPSLATWIFDDLDELEWESNSGTMEDEDSSNPD